MICNEIENPLVVWRGFRAKMISNILLNNFKIIKISSLITDNVKANTI